MNNPFLYVRTLVSLRVSQFVYLIFRRFFPGRGVISQKSEPRLRLGASLTSQAAPNMPFSGTHTFRFLNQDKRFSGERMDWSCRDMPKLWRYNLHYFDYLLDSTNSLETNCYLIADWIANNPPSKEDAWEPYTVSLRIVNWIEFFKRSEDFVRKEWVESLYQQALWLEGNIEYHILANHYLKNGVALFFVGVFFDGLDADRWLRKGRRILREELEEQFLGDGGHYERSPMYHSICVMDYLNVLNLMAEYSSRISFNEKEVFESRITQALNFLAEISLPDSEIPLFNDSAFGIAHPPKLIFERACEVLDYRKPAIPCDQVAVEKPCTGYYILRCLDDMMVIDCGAIGPEYQPGHAHCDALSYELAIDGQRIIVDSGVFDYEPSPERAYARSTRAHNTVVIDGKEQSEVWGVFRVARRARPISAHIERKMNGIMIFKGSHDGYSRLSGQPIHNRRIEYDGQRTWLIKDVIEGRGVHRIESYLHVHPDFRVVKNGSRIQIIESSGRTLATIMGSDMDTKLAEVSLEKGLYFPEFGLKQENQVIVFSCSGQLPLDLSYRIEKVDPKRS